MTYTKLIDILPDEMPDEAVHHLVNFMNEPSLVLESHYFDQLRRYHHEREHEHN